jgi:TRAP-type mannitol/chloroaromatic compound transport system permease large subunit
VVFDSDVRQSADLVRDPAFRLCAVLLQAGVAPKGYTMMHIYRGILPFVLLQLIGLAILVLFPALITWLPALFFGAS